MTEQENQHEAYEALERESERLFKIFIAKYGGLPIENLVKYLDSPEFNDYKAAYDKMDKFYREWKGRK